MNVLTIRSFRVCHVGILGRDSQPWYIAASLGGAVGGCEASGVPRPIGEDEDATLGNAESRRITRKKARSFRSRWRLVTLAKDARVPNWVPEARGWGSRHRRPPGLEWEVEGKHQKPTG